MWIIATGAMMGAKKFAIGMVNKTATTAPAKKMRPRSRRRSAFVALMSV
jgi:hypothetical protein